MTGDQMKEIAEKIRSADPKTRRNGLIVLRATLQLTITMIDAYLEKEGGTVNGKNEKQTDDEEPRVEGTAGAAGGTPE